MAVSRKFRQFAAPLLVALPPILAANTAVAAPTWLTEPASAWQVAEITDDHAIRINTTVAAGTLHALCTTSGCELFVEPVSGCMPGSTYPLLVNSAEKTGVTPARCMMVRQAGDSIGLVSHVVRSKPLMADILAGRDISIAFPTQAGNMDVLNIRSAGAAKVLLRAIQKTGKSASAAEKTRPSIEKSTKPASGATTRRDAAIAMAVRRSPMRYEI